MRINLLPESYRPQPQVRFLNVIILFVGVVSLGVVGSFATMAFLTNQNLTNESAQLTKAINSLQSQLNEAREKEALFAEVEKLHKEITDLRSQYQEHSVIFRKVSSVTLNDIWLTDALITNKGKIEMTGNSLIFPQLGEFLDRIIKLNSFKKPRLNQISQQKNEDVTYYNFKLEMETGRDSLEYAKDKRP